jgi:hypothetical protein
MRSPRRLDSAVSLQPPTMGMPFWMLNPTETVMIERSANNPSSQMYVSCSQAGQKRGRLLSRR